MEGFMTEECSRRLPRLSFCGDFVIRGGWKLGPREIAEYEVVYFPAGSHSTYETGGRTYSLDEPCYLLTKPGETHAYVFDAEKPIRHIFCHFVLEPDGGGLSPEALPVFVRADGVPHVPALLKYIVYLTSAAAPRYQERTSALLLAVLEELSTASRAGAGFVEGKRPSVPLPITNALAEMEERLHESISIRELADRAGWSHEYFTRVFVSSLGMSPKQYVLRRRIERASELLRLQDLSVKEIAYRVGFQSEQYFSRVFVRHAGITATKYRDRHADPRILNLHLAPPNDIAAPYPLNRMFGPAFPT
ncbi:helix-turn-helix domain-containing protein [Paenibacillus antri]|uniref:Helix-turn-helix domain-containing protein n=1 Tax=Paenibacillus antri TaxID=2582848 RepID=A0A5R9G6F6_9BACL|nr:helix-turn-helix transcriptional regulator [Paenibacillus antri]TLS50629.1 helix-turn-helix domain-containing protein [Paenibacillus antri]